MQSVLVFSLLVLGLTAQARSAEPSPLIVGGSLASISSYPSLASLLRSNDYVYYTQHCVGTILTSRTILTSASCVYGDNPSRWRMRVGSSWANSGGSVYNANRIIVHAYYNPQTFDSDIALIQSAATIIYNSVVKAATIAGSNYQLLDNQAVISVGWGTTSYGGSKSEQLRHVGIWTVNQIICRSRYAALGNSVTDNMVCSGWLNMGGRGQCSGDGGGPLLHNNVVVGISSWGYLCGQADYPDVNTRVSRYTSWIQANA